MQKIKLNDEVVVIAGKDKGKTGKVLKLSLKNSAVVVEGVNKARKAIKPTQENPTGGFVDVEKSIHLSNIQLLSPKTKKGTRVKVVAKNGKNARVAVKCGTEVK